MRRLLTASFIVLLCPLAQSGHAADVAIRAPVRCSNGPSCGQDITLDEAKTSAAGASAQKIECLKTKRDGECDLVSRTEDHICNRVQADGGNYYWGRVEDFKDGDAALGNLLSRAKDGAPFEGSQIVEAETSLPDEQHLALCGVKTISGVFGPPSACVTVAIISSQERWLRGGQFPGRCHHSASFRPSGAINILFDITTSKTPDLFSNSLKNMLESDLGLTTEFEIGKDAAGRIEWISFESAAGLRDSKILPNGWRESLTFDLHLTTSNALVQIRATANAMVSRQAVGSLTGYQGLDDVQRNAYADALNDRVKGAIKAACDKFESIDARKISCN
jgi:hypothetical protein